MKLRRAFADANKIVRRSMDFRYIGELSVQTLKQQAISHRLQNIVKVMAKGGEHNLDITNSA